MVYIIMICMTVPLLLLMTMLDNKSRLLLGFVLCGMVLAVCAYEINSLVCYSLQLSGPELSITAAPVIEEILKALPVLFFAVLVSDERKQILQLAMAVGIGFAILENAFLLLTYVDEVDIGWAIARGISTSLSHGILLLLYFSCLFDIWPGGIAAVLYSSLPYLIFRIFATVLTGLFFWL